MAFLCFLSLEYYERWQKLRRESKHSCTCKDMKYEQKRINNDDFEQVERCITCKRLFWAKSYLEMGNWEYECKKCRMIRNNKNEEEHEFIKKNGKARYGGNGIFAWTLGEKTTFNMEYEPTEKEYERWANGIIDIDKFEKIAEMAQSKT